MTRTFDETAMWSAALAGDSRAFSTLFDQHYDRVFRHVLGLVDQRADADEVSGAAFLELWRRRDRVRVVQGSVLPWLLVTATNLARNHGRKANRYRAVLRSLPRDTDHLDATTAIEDEEDSRYRAQALARELDRLRPIDAQLIDLTSRAGFTIQDAAEAVGISPAAARVRLHRVRARLRQRLAPDLQPSYPNEGR